MAKIVAVTSVALAALLVGLSVRADDKDRPTSDNDFLTKAVSCSINESQLSGLAAKQATNAKVREFAARIVKDHKQMNEGLLQQARGLKIGVVTGLDKEQREKYDALAKLQGADFDRQYMNHMVDALERLHSGFNYEASDGKLDGLRDFAKKNAEELKKDLDDAKKIRDDLGK
jgi:putative membrane protein